MACLLVRGSACTQGPPDGAAPANTLPPRVATYPSKRVVTRENGTAQDDRSRNPLLLFLVTGRLFAHIGFLASRHQWARHPVTLPFILFGAWHLRYHRLRYISADAELKGEEAQEREGYTVGKVVFVFMEGNPRCALALALAFIPVPSGLSRLNRAVAQHFQQSLLFRSP
jgi:hypothetical protein